MRYLVRTRVEPRARQAVDRTDSRSTTCKSLLAKEDTYCNDQMTESERRWLREHRSPEAAAWRLLSDLRAEHLTHVA